jgi:hypothetical protein
MGEHGRAMITTHTRREEGVIFRIGSVAGIVGALLAMVGNLLHPATPSGDPEGVAQTIAESENWVLVHLVIVVGLIIMLGGLVAISRSIEGGLPGALPQLVGVRRRRVRRHRGGGPRDRGRRRRQAPRRRVGGGAPRGSSSRPAGGPGRGGHQLRPGRPVQHPLRWRHLHPPRARGGLER